MAFVTSDAVVRHIDGSPRGLVRRRRCRHADTGTRVDYVNGTGNELGTPGDVVGLTGGVVAITAGGQHTCALMSSGAVKCWGINDRGALGDGTTTWRRNPFDVVGLSSGVSAVTAGASHSCAILVAGGIKCWGAHWRGQPGTGSTGEGSIVPVDVDFAHL